MTTPTSFEAAKGISDNLGPVARNAMDRTAIDKILSRSNQEGTPEETNNLIGFILKQISPENRDAAMKIVQNKQEGYRKAKEQKSFQGLASNIRSNFPDSPEMQSIADVMESDLPAVLKEKFSKTISDNVPYRQAQQMRLTIDSKMKILNQQMRAIDNDIKENPYDDGLIAKKRGLQKEVEALKNTANKIFPLEEPRTGQQKEKFDPKNQEHIKIKEEILVESNGDKKKANIKLNEIFE